MATCGKCDAEGVTVDHVRSCYGLPPRGTSFVAAVPDNFKAKEEQPEWHNPRGPATSIAVKEGFYILDNRIFKVVRAVHGSGNLYAKELIADSSDPEVRKGTWTYLPGMLPKLSAGRSLSLQEACHLGKLYGFCVRCGRTLTKESSIERGMGDICAGKWDDG